jgi:hypothetical protein
MYRFLLKVYPLAGLSAVLLAGKPVESPSAVRHVDELMSSRSEPNGLQVERPVAAISFADSLRKRRDLVARHPDRNPDHKRLELKPWLSAVRVKPFICCLMGW